MATYNAFTAIKKKYTPTTTQNSNQLYSNAYAAPKAASTTQSVAVPYANANMVKTTPAAKTTDNSAYNAFTPSSAVDTYEQKMKKLYQEQQDQLAAQKQQSLADTNKTYDYAKQYYESSIPSLQNNFNTYEANANADIKAMQDSAAAQKASTSESYLAAQKDALTAQRNQEAKTAQEFAALGTIDSGGVGSYSRARENILSDANSFRQSNNMKMASALADIDSQLGSAERTAQQAILTERSNLEAAIREINYNLGTNEQARQNALNQVVSNYNTSVSSIQQELATLQYNLAQQAEQLKGSQLSEQFMKTDIPQTQTDYQYKVENAGNYQKLQASQNAGKVTDTDKQTGSEIYSLTKGILDENRKDQLERISGRSAHIATWLNPKATDMKAEVKRISDLLTVKSRNALKGQGQISDAETRMLANAQSILENTGITYDTMVAELQRIQEDALKLANGDVTYAAPTQSYNTDSLSNDQIAQILQSLGN